MRDLFKSPHRPKWILLVVGNNHVLRREQQTALAPYAEELAARDVVVVNVTPTETSILNGDCHCKKSADEIAELYEISLEDFSATLISRDDCVKWAAPIPMSFKDIITVIEEMPHRDAENATRGPASSM